MEGQNYSTGIGQGAAQVFGSSDFLNVRNGQEAARRRNEEGLRKREADRAKSIKEKNRRAMEDGVRKLKADSLKIDTKGMHFNDVKPFQDDLRKFLDSYNGRWEEMYNSPELLSEFNNNMQDFRLKIEESRAKKDWYKTTLNAMMKDPDNYNEDDRSIFLDIAETYGKGIKPIIGTEKVDLNEWERTEVAPFIKELFDNSIVEGEGIDEGKNRKFGSKRQQIPLDQARSAWANIVASADEKIQAKIIKQWSGRAEEAGEDDVLKFYIEEQAKISHAQRIQENKQSVLSNSNGDNFKFDSSKSRFGDYNLGGEDKDFVGSLKGTEYNLPELNFNAGAGQGIRFMDDLETPKNAQTFSIKVNSIILPEEDGKIVWKKASLAKGKSKTHVIKREPHLIGTVSVFNEKNELVGVREALIDPSVARNKKGFKSKGWQDALNELNSRSRGSRSNNSSSSSTAEGDNIFKQ